MDVTVIKGENSNIVLIVDTSDPEILDEMTDVVTDVRHMLNEMSEEKGYTVYTSDDVVLTVDGGKVND